MSDCCGARIIEDSDVCSACFEHCSEAREESTQQFEDILNKAIIKGYSKLSLKQPLSESGFEDWKKEVKDYYGYSDKELNEALNLK